MPLIGEITPGISFFCPHCGALYAVTLSKRREIASGLGKMCGLRKDHGRVEINLGSGLPARSST